MYCHKMREMNLIFHFSHGIDFYVSINLMTLGGCYALYFIVADTEREWHNQNVKDIDKSEFGRYICRS